nr:hypothetical protein [Amycolatopsis arida]
MDLAVDAGPVGRGGHQQLDPPGVALGEVGQHLAGVADVDLAATGSAVVGGEGEVGVGDVGPPVFVLDAEGVAAFADGFDQGGADSAHGVEDEIAGGGVGVDGVAGDGGQHRCHRFRQVRADGADDPR